MDCFVSANGIRLHYLHYAGEQPTMILMHGLTANAHAFDGLIHAGLVPAFNILSIDLRGRGQSDVPDDYTMAAHAKDIIGLMDNLKIENAVIGGHSFGALLTFYLAAHYPERVNKMILMDAAARMHPNTKEMLAPALSRLGQVFHSFEHYLEKVKAAPYMEFWDDEMQSYYEADVKEYDHPSVMPIPELKNMISAVNGGLAEPWVDYIKTIDKAALLINGTGVYTMGAALLPEENALETVGMMKNCSYVKVPGNHQTMLYREGAKEIVNAIKTFLSK